MVGWLSWLVLRRWIVCAIAIILRTRRRLGSIVGGIRSSSRRIGLRRLLLGLRRRTIRLGSVWLLWIHSYYNTI